MAEEMETRIEGEEDGGKMEEGRKLGSDRVSYLGASGMEAA